MEGEEVRVITGMFFLPGWHFFFGFRHGRTDGDWLLRGVYFHQYYGIASGSHAHPHAHSSYRAK